MRLLFDHNMPWPLRGALAGHEVAAAAELGWNELANGALIAAAEAAGFDVLVTADQNIAYQQSLANRRLGLVVLSTNQWPVVPQHVERIVAAIGSAGPGCFIAIDLPRTRLVRRPPPKFS